MFMCQFAEFSLHENRIFGNFRYRVGEYVILGGEGGVACLWHAVTHFPLSTCYATLSTMQLTFAVPPHGVTGCIVVEPQPPHRMEVPPATQAEWRNGILRWNHSRRINSQNETCNFTNIHTIIQT